MVNTKKPKGKKKMTAGAGTGVGRLQKIGKAPGKGKAKPSKNY